MRVNVYAEEMTDRIEIISKEIDGHKFTGLRFYLELPVTVGGQGQPRVEGAPISAARVAAQPAESPSQIAGPFIHRPGDDDSAAVTFWGKRDLREALKKALAMLDKHYEELSKLKAIAEDSQPRCGELVHGGYDRCILQKNHDGQHSPWPDASADYSFGYNWPKK